jgi:hypothetical protein
MFHGWRPEFRWSIPLPFWKWNFVNFHYTSRSFRLGPYSRNSRGRESFDVLGWGYLRRHRFRR